MTSRARPSSWIWPRESQMPREHRFSTAAMLCETKSTVRPPLQIGHGGETLLLEGCIAHGEHLIDDQYVGVEVRSDRKAESRAHSTRVALDWGVDEPAQPREFDYRLEFRVDFLLLHPHDRTVEVDVFAPGELLVKTRAYLEQCSNPSSGLNPAGRGIRDLREDL